MKFCLWTETKAKPILLNIYHVFASWDVPKDIKIGQKSFGKIFFEQKEVEFNFYSFNQQDYVLGRMNIAYHNKDLVPSVKN